MSTLNDDDTFLYQDTDGNTGRVANSNRSSLQDEDVFLVQREGTTYRVKASDVGTGGGAPEGIPARQAGNNITYDNATPVNLDPKQDQSVGQDKALYFAYSDYSVNEIYIRWISGQSDIEVRGYKSTNDINDYDNLYTGNGNFTLDEYLNYPAIRIWATSDAVFSFKHDDVSRFPLVPSIVSPAEGSVNDTSTVDFKSSPALLTSGQPGEWSTANWQLATSPDFVSGFQQESTTLTGGNPEQGPTSFNLTTSTNYYTRTKYSTTENKLSPWSDVRSFATSAARAFTAQLLLVGAGGGAGGELGGGGGAGGFRLWSNATGGLTVFSDTNYFIQVGAGGGALNGLTAGTGSQGINTYFGDLVAAGGGGGGGYQNYTAGNGGSGGGQGNTFPGGFGNVPSVSPSQGNDGGGSRNYGGGGGGGATVKGQDGPGSDELSNPNVQGNGGNGNDTVIRGFVETFAGGGGGGGATGRSAGGSGGSGGGGTGGGGTDSGKDGNGTNGSASSGGGGGGSAWSAGAVVAGNGGSGILIIRYPFNFTISNPDGGLSISHSNVGGDKVATVTLGAGNIIFT